MIQEFSLEFISNNDLEVVPMMNTNFIWYRPSNKRSRLDRALINSSCSPLGNWTAQGLHLKSSDRRPLLNKISGSSWGPKPFKLFNCWLENNTFIQYLGYLWKNSNCKSIHLKIRELKGYSRKWNRAEFGNIDLRIDMMEKAQEEADANNIDDFSRSKIKNELDDLYKLKSSMLC